MKLALSGEPQVVRHRNGDEVVVISRTEYDSLRPSLKEFLLSAGTCEDADELENAISSNGSQGITALGYYPRDDD